MPIEKSFYFRFEKGWMVVFLLNLKIQFKLQVKFRI